MKPYKSPYKRGADDGAWFGLYLTALFYSSVYSGQIAILGLVSLALVAGVPVLIYFALRRTYLEESLTSRLSALWMQGIMTFLCGAMIAGALSIIYLKWINPTYLVDMVTQSIDIYRQTGDPSLAKMADGLQMMVDAGAVPSPIAMVFTVIWSSVLSGSVLSLILSLIIRARHTPRREYKVKN